MSRNPSRSGNAPTRSIAPFHRGPASVAPIAPVAQPNVTPPAHAPNAALLIDFDNVTMGIRSDLQEELKNLLSSDIIKGKVAVRRAYADWRRYPQYIVPLTEASIDLIFAPAYGSSKKNATDIRLAIDALELVFTRPEIGTFVLLSGDSDFSSMVIKLKEYGKYVIGVGIRESSSDLLVMNCDEYYSYNALAGLVRSGEDESTRWDPWALVTEAVGRMKRNGDVMRSDRLKQVMQEIDASFDEKNLGHPKFSRFVQEAQQRGLLTVTKLESGQLEIDVPEGGLPPVTPPAAAEVPADGESRETREAREDRDRRGRRGRRGRGRDRFDRDREPREGDAAAMDGAEPAAPGDAVDAALEVTAEIPTPVFDATGAVIEPEGIRPLPGEEGTREERDDRGRRRGRGRGRDRFRDRREGERAGAEGDAPAVALRREEARPDVAPAFQSTEVSDEIGRSGERLTRGDAFDLVRRAVEALVEGDACTTASATRQRAFELLGRDSESLASRMFERILQDAHDANMIDLRRRGNDWEVARAADAASIVEQLKTVDEAQKAEAKAAAALLPAAPRGMGARGIGGRGKGPGAPPPGLLMVGVVGAAKPAAPVAAPVAAEVRDTAAPAAKTGAKAPAKKAAPAVKKTAPAAKKAAPAAKKAAVKAPAKKAAAPAKKAAAPAKKAAAPAKKAPAPAKKAAAPAKKAPAKKAAKKR
ncbi:NYN domain-containing protein [Gemmatimonas sp.]|jgi:uncharacterized protein (TIGR00288 family)|uniref:NYN domain-containing protein n=1 Tax=Gemmatimonas sp. TaxID=1962908 RepID=UPI0037BE3908